jgi:polysaccharide deacetylase 2 family uncharacterized protein YibQ
MAKRRKKQSRRSAGTPARVKFLLAVLIIVLVAGVALVKFLQTPRGRVVLLDSGFSGYYGQVQQDIEPHLRASLKPFGLLKGLRERVERVTVGKRQFHVRKWTASCTDCSLVPINLAITKAVSEAGAVVRSSEEREGGDLLALEIGSARFTTHNIEIRRRPAPETEPPAVSRDRAPVGKIAIVIDDFGYSKSKLIESFLSIDFPITVAVIPSLRHSKRSLDRAAKNGKQTILHVPMEAEAFASDVAAVMTAMSEADIAELLGRFLDRSPGVVGINNHMGSKATQDPRVMDAVMTVLKGHDLFFLDSLTSSKSIAYTRARMAGVPTARNDVFLDAETEDPLVVRDRLKRLIEIARQNGSAIGIGHPRPWTYEAVGGMPALLEGSGVELVFISELMK